MKHLKIIYLNYCNFYINRVNESNIDKSVYPHMYTDVINMCKQSAEIADKYFSNNNYMNTHFLYEILNLHAYICFRTDTTVSIPVEK